MGRKRNIEAASLCDVEKAARAVAKAARSVDAAQAELVAAMAAAYQAGNSYRTIAQAANLSHEKVRQLIERGHGAGA